MLFCNVYFCIIDTMTLNLSSSFTLMAMYRSFSKQFKWNNWTSKFSEESSLPIVIHINPCPAPNSILYYSSYVSSIVNRDLALPATGSLCHVNGRLDYKYLGLWR